MADVQAAARRLEPYLSPTPLRRYPALDQAMGCRVLVKHENHQPTCSFKVRNGLAALTALDPEERRRGVVAATRGNHGLGLAYAGHQLGVGVTICVPLGNNPEKNQAMRCYGAELVEQGPDYDVAVEVMQRLVRLRGLRAVHSTNEPLVIAGAATLTAELLDQAEALGQQPDALVLAVGGGSQAVGAMTVIRHHQRKIPVYGIQAAGAPAIHDSWHAGKPLTRDSAETMADGVATRMTYEVTFEALCQGLEEMLIVTEEEIAQAIRRYLRMTHNLAEGAGALGLAGLGKLRQQLEGKTVAVAGHKYDVKALVFGPGAKQLISGSEDRSIRVWSTSDGKLVRQLSGDIGEVRALALTPDGRWLAAAGRQGSVRLRRMPTGATVWTADRDRVSEVLSYHLSNDGQLLATGGRGEIKVFDLKAGSLRRALPFSAKTDNIVFVAISRDRRKLASGSGPGMLVRWDLNTGSRLADAPVVPRVGGRRPGPRAQAAAPPGRVRSFLGVYFLLPGDRIMAAGGGDGGLRLVDLVTGKLVGRLKQKYGVRYEAFSSTGSLQRASPRPRAFSPDGRQLALAMGHTIQLWEISAERLIRTFSGFSDSFDALAYSPDGKLLAGA